jgi:16S rRNA processing protein RimM
MGAPDSFEIGVVSGAHGLGGVLRVRMFDAATRVCSGDTLTLRAPSSEQRTTITVRDVADVPGKRGQLRVAADEVGDRNAAEALAGWTIEIPRAAVAPPADDEFFLADAVGLPVLRKRDDAEPAAPPRELGTIIAITSNGVQDLFEVRYRAKDGRMRTWLLPVLPHVIRDVTTTAVWIDPPLGLVPEELEDES